MAISEKLCWEVLEMTKGKSIPRSWLKGSPSDEPPYENAMPEIAIEHDLVLRHSKAQIEDSLYFLHKRGYLFQHGHKGLTRVLLQLSPKALQALETGEFDKDEQIAFKDAVFDVKTPGWLGMKVNLGELWRRFKKKRRQ